MPQRQLAPGLSVTHSTAVEVLEGTQQRSRSESTRRRGTQRARRAAPPEADVTPLLRELERQGFHLVSEFTVAPRPTRTTTSGRRAASLPGMSAPTALNLDLADDEDAVVMTVDDSGELDWVFPDGTRVSPSARRAGRAGLKRAKRARGPRTVTFTIPLTTAPRTRPRQGGRRNPFRKLLKGVAGWVFKFVRQKVTGLLIRHLEKGVRKGLVRVTSNVPSEWSPLGEEFVLPTIEPAPGTPPRVLLLVHGTFSSTVGSFGGLAFTTPGLSLINALQRQYDHVIGWDHYTLSDTPAENAREILAALERAFPRGTPRPEIDAIAFSRGGLVLRTLLEREVPGTRWEAAFRRAVFVASTLSGTKLAQRAHWKHFITIISNLAVAACRGVATAIPPAAVAAVWVETVARGVAALVRFLATALIDEEAVPGLAAMDPDQKVVKEINAAAPGDKLLARYHAVTNDFEPNGPGAAEASEAMPSGLKLKLWDLVMDAQMREANDLVVHTRSMSTVANALLPAERTLALPQNGRTMHTTCFRDATVIAQLRAWLVDHEAAAAGGRASRRGINRRLRARRARPAGAA